MARPRTSKMEALGSARARGCRGHAGAVGCVVKDRAVAFACRSDSAGSVLLYDCWSPTSAVDCYHPQIAGTGYNGDFFAAGASGAEQNVAAVLPLVVAELGALPATVIDVGCGAGAWVREFLKAGIDAAGWDGSWAEPHLMIPRERFTARDLTETWPRDRRFDMAVTIEVAEHLPPTRGPGFVSDLCAISDAVLFSASVPRQRGTHHVNLRWQPYWVDLFTQEGYGVIDCIRPAVWDRAPPVGWPLAQQCFLFVRGREPRVAMPLNVVHPDSWLAATEPSLPSLRGIAHDMPGAVTRSVHRHARRLWASTSRT